MLAPGLCTESTDLGQILNKDFVAFSGSEIRDSKQLSGHLVIGNGIDIDMAGPSFVPVDSPVRLSRSFPKIFRGIDVHGRRMAVSTLGELTRPRIVCAASALCTSSESAGYLQMLHGLVGTGASRHFKEFERESVREYRTVLDSMIDRYSMGQD
ncbi:hypothetical protein DL89DRAFT_134072 [Linderina pennispora]|uniref:Uncharacterized protein n=1 Tax=Linderina pennispora TaxID=61395 RepID=A0A1Y1VUT2_9FUNG|nr:uncharacterized protein DL89DRAFT_134072 [Linderina pennispora]ORX65049.1 hypothetical protein DL89DRAFT_134072 [Linderina pennispora]